MDHDVKAFRAAAGRENGSRTGLQRRYSPALRAQAVRCWRGRRRAGESLRDVAVALGVAPWSLHRWARSASLTRARFHPVQVVPAAVPSVDAGLVVVVNAESTRVEGLDVESAARLLALLR
jgi:transposase-like protein